MSDNFNPLAKVSFDMMLRPIQIVKFDDAKFDIYMISGFLTEKWYLPYGAHTVKMGELANSYWLRHLVKLAAEHHFNLYFYNWAAQSLLKQDDTFFNDFKSFFGGVKTDKPKYNNSSNNQLPIDDDFEFLGSSVSFEKSMPFWMRVFSKANQAKEAIKPNILKKWNDALEATIPAAMELEKFVLSTNRRTVLLGHSLGGRVALKTMEFIHSKQLEPISCIAMAPAIRCSELNMQRLNNRANRIELFFSESDSVLSLIYRLAELTFEKPIGLKGADSKIGREVDCSQRNKQSTGHNDYEANILSLLSESDIFMNHIKVP